jgi:hypothetical protein
MFGAPLMLGVVAGFDFLSSWQLNVTVSKSKTENTGFGLNVAVTGDPVLQGLDDNGNYTRELCPGKVSAYRFNAFYLAPDTENGDAFSGIVDQNWLRSSDPNAVALRGASFAGSPVWRVLYRVTYVSRVPPAFNNAPNETPEPEFTTTINVEDNAALIALVITELASNEPTPANLGAAITAVMNPSSTTSRLGQSVPWWDAARATADPEWLAALLYDTLVYMLTGFANGVLTTSGRTASSVRVHPQTAAFLRSSRPVAGRRQIAGPSRRLRSATTGR